MTKAATAYWLDRLPTVLAMRQSGWDRRQRMLRALQSGATQAEIARSLKISRCRVGQIIARARRDHGRSPVEIYLSRNDDLWPLRESAP